MKSENLELEKKINRVAFIKRILISVVIGLVIFSIVFFFSWFNGIKIWIYYLANAFFVSGVFLAASGVLSAINKEGFFDVAQFGFRQLWQTIKYSVSMNRDARIDTDIISFKKAKRNVRVANWSGLIVGLVFIASSFVASAFVK